jgi:hypothetical protein
MPEPTKIGRRDWSWFWFNDRHAHLTPERVTGGIY